MLSVKFFCIVCLLEFLLFVCSVEETTPESGTGILDSLSRQRIKIHMKLLGQLGQQTSQPIIKEDKPTYREQFVPPKMSMVSLFMSKVSIYLELEIKFVYLNVNPAKQLGIFVTLLKAALLFINIYLFILSF